MTPEEIAKAAIAKMNKKITNEIFLVIQNDSELMHEYLRAVEREGLDKVCQDVGKTVKAVYCLENQSKGNIPSCTLIYNHKMFE